MALESGAAPAAVTAAAGVTGDGPKQQTQEQTQEQGHEAPRGVLGTFARHVQAVLWDAACRASRALALQHTEEFVHAVAQGSTQDADRTDGDATRKRRRRSGAHAHASTVTATYTVRGFVLASGSEPMVLLRHASPLALDSEIVALGSVLSAAHDVVWAPAAHFPVSVWNDTQGAYVGALGDPAELCTATPGSDRALVMVMRGAGCNQTLQLHLDTKRFAFGSCERFARPPFGNTNPVARVVGGHVSTETDRDGGLIPPPPRLAGLAVEAVGVSYEPAADGARTRVLGGAGEQSARGDAVGGLPTGVGLSVKRGSGGRDLAAESLALAGTLSTVFGADLAVSLLVSSFFAVHETSAQEMPSTDAVQNWLTRRKKEWKRKSKMPKFVAKTLQ